MSTNQLRRYLDLLNEANVVPPNTEVALPSAGTFSNDDALAAALAQQNSEPRCTVCGTPQSQHQTLKHEFVPGGAADRPAPVSQSGGGSGADVPRIKQLQRELLAAGANLGQTGANRDGIDGDIGPLTRAAMQKYPDIAAKYADLGAGQGATPGNTAQLNSALTAIESILAKYKIKLNEDLTSSIMEAGPTAQQRQAYQDAIQRNLPPDTVTPTATSAASAATTNPYVQRPGGSREAQAWQAEKAAQTASTSAAGAAEQGAAAAAGKGLARGAAGIVGKAVGKAAGRAIPGVGLALGGYDAYERAKEGDYVGAGISGLSGIASLFPLVGTAISLGLAGVNLYRDLNTTPTVAITAADAKTIADNIKIIQDWQKDPANQAALTPDFKNRIANVLKGVATLGVPTQAATPTQPSTTPAANPKLNQINQTLDAMDQLLKKNKYESVSNKKSPPLTEAERMARLRDIVTEDVSDYIPDLPTAAAGYGLYKYGQSRGAAQAATTATTGWLAKLNQGLTKAYSMAKTGTKWGLILAAGAAILAIINAFRENPDAAKASGLTVEDMQQFEQLYAQLQQLINDEATFNSLPPEVQQKTTDIAKRALKMAAGIANRKALEP